jgi:hypothetical protein
MSGIISSVESDTATARSLEKRANAALRLSENRLFTIIHQIMEKELLFESVSLKKHYVDPAVVHNHLTALGFFDEEGSALPQFVDTIYKSFSKSSHNECISRIEE